MPKEEALRQAEAFGWTDALDEGDSLAWTTGLRPGASAVVLDGVVESVRVRTSPAVGDDAAGRRALRDQFGEQVAAAREELGPPSTQSPGRRPQATWMLPNGSVLRVAASSVSCYWTLTSPHLAEVQRDLGES